MTNFKILQMTDIICSSGYVCQNSEMLEFPSMIRLLALNVKLTSKGDCDLIWSDDDKINMCILAVEYSEFIQTFRASR